MNSISRVFITLLTIAVVVGGVVSAAKGRKKPLAKDTIIHLTIVEDKEASHLLIIKPRFK